MTLYKVIGYSIRKWDEEYQRFLPSREEAEKYEESIRLPLWEKYREDFNTEIRPVYLPDHCG